MWPCEGAANDTQACPSQPGSAAKRSQRQHGAAYYKQSMLQASSSQACYAPVYTFLFAVFHFCSESLGLHIIPICVWSLSLRKFLSLRSSKA